MLYLKDNKISKDFLFIHIPKCAGTSIEKLFGYNYNVEKHLEHRIKLVNNEHPKHLTLNSYYNHFDNEFLDKIFKFTIVRNPFDAIVSLYNFSIKDDNVIINGLNTYEQKKNISFDQFVNIIVDTANSNEMYLSQVLTSYEKFTDYDDKKLDFIGRFENLNSDFDIICNELGIENNLPHVNNTEYDKDNDNDNYKDYYTNYSKNKVARLFYNDIVKYKYDF